MPIGDQIKCNKCGLLFTNTGTGYTICKCPPQPVGLTGWICPICGKGNSPYTQTCPCQPFNCPTIFGGQIDA